MCGSSISQADSEKQARTCCSRKTDPPVKICGPIALSVPEKHNTAKDECDPPAIIPDERRAWDSTQETLVVEEKVDECCTGSKAECGELPMSTDECSKGCCDDEDIESSEDGHQIGGGCCSSTGPNQVAEGSEPRDTACGSVCCVTPPADAKKTAGCRPNSRTAHINDCCSTSPAITDGGCCSKEAEETELHLQTNSGCCSKVTGSECDSAPASPVKSDCCSNQPTPMSKGCCSDQISVPPTLDEAAGCCSKKEPTPKPISNDGCCKSTSPPNDDNCCGPTTTDAIAPSKSCCTSSTSQVKAKTGCWSAEPGPRRRKSSVKPTKVKSIPIGESAHCSRLGSSSLASQGRNNVSMLRRKYAQAQSHR
jgi:hypothetical protein